MTCSSSTTSAVEPRSGWTRALAAGVLLAGLIAPAAADSGAAERALARASRALAAGDGISAEARLREARAAGASADLLRAPMGEALLAQGDLLRARRWLEPARFAPATRGRGFHMLGRLELRAGRLPEAGRAFDRALAANPAEPGLWIDIARLRLAGGEFAPAVAAAERAVALAPGDAETLRFRGTLIRRQQGFAAALPWFEAALRRAPGDPGILADKAATLGELGRYAEALATLRAEPGGPRVLYQQAVIAARGGDRALARRLLARAAKGLGDLPGALQLGAALELDAGNTNAAAAIAERLLQRQPGNAAGQDLLARALARNGDPEAVLARLGALAEADGASPYLRTIVARAYEEMNRRDRAVALLARAAAPTPIPPGGVANAVLDIGAHQVLGADLGLRDAGRDRDADVLAFAYAAEHPQDAFAVRHLANVRARNGQWRESARLLEWLNAHGGGRDAALLADLAFARLREGRRDEARRLAVAAARLQPARRTVRAIVAMTAVPRD